MRFIAASRARVVHAHIRQRGGFVKTANRMSRFERLGIATGGHDDADPALGWQARVPRLEPAGGRCLQQRQQRLAERQEHLRLGISETRVELDHHRPIGRQHQAAIEKAGVRVAFLSHAREHGLDNLGQYARVQSRRRPAGSA